MNPLTIVIMSPYYWHISFAYLFIIKWSNIAVVSRSFRYCDDQIDFNDILVLEHLYIYIILQ